MIRDLNLSESVEIPQLTDHGLEILSNESPRRQRLLLQIALGRAIAAKKAQLDLAPKLTTKSRSMGFY
jgi:hypothetical protein